MKNADGVWVKDVFLPIESDGQLETLPPGCYVLPERREMRSFDYVNAMYNDGEPELLARILDWPAPKPVPEYLDAQFREDGMLVIKAWMPVEGKAVAYYQ